MNNCLPAILAIALSMPSLSGCGGDGAPGAVADGGPLPAPPQPVPGAYTPCEGGGPVGNPPLIGIEALPGGIWQGRLTNELLKSTEPYTAIVTDDGRFVLQSTGHTQWIGSLATSEDAFTGAGFAESGGTPWHDGTLVSELFVAGALAERETFAGSWALASGDAGCFDFSFDAGLYERPSSLDTVTGPWLAFDGWGFPWLSLTVEADGSFSGTDYSGCIVTGRFNLLDVRYNLYEVQSTVAQGGESGWDCYFPGTYTGVGFISDQATGSRANDLLYLSLIDGTTAISINFNRQ